MFDEHDRRSELMECRPDDLDERVTALEGVQNRGDVSLALVREHSPAERLKGGDKEERARKPAPLL
jgi:hypothetical protein